jgi:hypothetical protein
MRQLRNITALGRLGACIVVGGSLPAALGAPQGFVGVPAANPKVAGVPVPNVLTPELIETIAAQGSTRLENGTTDFPFYGYDGDGAGPAGRRAQSPGPASGDRTGDKNTPI